MSSEDELNCTAVQTWLIAESDDEPNSLTPEAVQAHLRRCATCRSRQELLIQFRRTLDLERHREADFDPALPGSLTFLRIARRRIPLYQAVLAGAAALALYAAASSLTSGKTALSPKESPDKGSVPASLDSQQVMGNLRLAERVGRSQREDSLLTRLLHETASERRPPGLPIKNTSPR